MAPSRIQIGNVLCPTDFSEFSTRALEHARSLARWFDAKVTVLHVIPVSLPGAGVPYFVAPLVVPPALTERARREVERFIGVPTDVPTSVCVREGEPWQEILKAAQELPADLLVMGTHGRGGFDRFLLGSVSEKVVRRSTCPVLTVSHESGSSGAPHQPFRRILCATDLSESSAATIDYALSLAEEGNATMLLLHVIEMLPERGGRFAYAGPDLAPLRQELEADARALMSKVVPESARQFCTVDERIVAGRAYREILRVAAEEKADLIVMGAHGPAPFGRMVFGSTAEHVVRHAPCPVLTVRSAGQARETEMLRVPSTQDVVA